LELFDLLDAALLEVHERAAEELRIFHRSFVGFWRLDVRLHNFQVPPGEIARKRRRRNQMSPGIPAVYERFGDDIWSEKKLFLSHYQNCSISPLGHTNGRRCLRNNLQTGHHSALSGVQPLTRHTVLTIVERP